MELQLCFWRRCLQEIYVAHLHPARVAWSSTTKRLEGPVHPLRCRFNLNFSIRSYRSNIARKLCRHVGDLGQSDRRIVDNLLLLLNSFAYQLSPRLTPPTASPLPETILRLRLSGLDTSTLFGIRCDCQLRAPPNTFKHGFR